MALFSKKKNEGGLLDVIRCDETKYLVWKWRPYGQDVNSTKKENSIRYGSSLRVKPGEVAVFFYSQKEGTVQDFIIGPYDETIKTANFPILSNIVGSAFGGNSPFQAEIYFINLQGNNQISFRTPYFDVFDPRFMDFSVPASVAGTLTFNISDYESFIKLNRLVNFDLDDFYLQISSAVNKYIKGVISNIPAEKEIPVLQLERKLLEINETISAYLKVRLENDFSINMKALDLAEIRFDEDSPKYEELRMMTARQQAKTTEAQTDINIKNMADMQNINATNMDETLRIQREELQRGQKLQTESNFMGVHGLNLQADVMKTAAESLGEMNANMGDGSGSGGMNPAGMMTGMMMGGALGQQMAGMMNQMGNNMNTQAGQQATTPPPLPSSGYMVAVNGQQSGPFTIQQLQQLVQNGQINADTLVWKQGMQNWVTAGSIAELTGIFNTLTPPPIPTL